MLPPKWGTAYRGTGSTTRSIAQNLANCKVNRIYRGGRTGRPCVIEKISTEKLTAGSGGDIMGVKIYGGDETCN